MESMMAAETVMPTWWTIASAVSAGLLPVLVAASTVIMWFVRASVKMANDDQLKELQKLFVPSMDSKITGREIEQILHGSKEDLEKLRDDFAKLEMYAHTRVHDLSNILQVKTMKEG